MTNSGPTNYFFIGAISVAIVLAILIFLPFLSPLVLAIALAVVFEPLHRWVIAKLFRGRYDSSLGALVTILIVAVVIFVPLTFVGLKVSREIQQLYIELTNPNASSPLISKVQDALGSSDVVSGLQSVTHWAFTNINAIFTRVTKILIEIFVMLLALFYLLRDGRELKRQLVSLSPLSDADDSHIINKLQVAIRSVFAGTITVGIIQGILEGLGFAIFGVPNPVLWGLVAAVAALIPGIGTALVLIPAVAYLFFSGSTGMAIGLLIWGALFVGLIDNFLGPVLVNRGVKIHPFLILLSVLGGLTFFGPVGFVIGPLIIALLFALLEIYKSPKKVL